jgi:hypothetical protein
MHWGMIRHWAADPSIGNRMINARAETLTELPSFKLLVNMVVEYRFAEGKTDRIIMCKPYHYWRVFRCERSSSFCHCCMGGGVAEYNSRDPARIVALHDQQAVF